MSLHPQPCVRVERLTKHHGRILAVDDLSFDVNKGEFFSILGPSGSGKTTTLQLIAGLQHPDQGDIYINGQSVKGLPPQKRPVNTVFQHYALFPHLNVWKNVAFGLQMQGVPRKEIHVRVGEALDIVRMGNKADRLPSQLSGGEQQRVAVARALINQPQVMLLDEPLGALDQQLRQEMQRELKTIQRQLGLTCICVTHHQSEALLMSDRVGVMKEGRLAQIGEPETLYERPKTAFVAQFVGQSNCVEGEIVGSNQNYSIFQPKGMKSFLIPRCDSTMMGKRALVILRPERLRVGRKEISRPQENVVEAVIAQTYYLGEEIQYDVTLDAGVLWTVRDATPLGPQDRFRPGERALLSWRIDQSHVFLV